MSEVWRRIDAEWPDKPYYNMAVEEAIPRMVEAGKVPNTIRFWRNANTIVIGRFQCPTLEIKFSECLKYSVEVIRRFTGGGAVYHDLGNLNYAVSIRRPHPKFSGDLLEAFKTICECVIEGLKILGVNAYFKPINDIEVNGRKISGLAGMITKNLIFIHGCILISSNLSILNRVLNIPKEYLESKRISDVKARVTTLRDELGRDVSVEEVKNALAEGFEKRLNIRLKLSSLTGEEVKLAEDLYKNKYLTWEWNMGPCKRCPTRDSDEYILQYIRARW